MLNEDYKEMLQILLSNETKFLVVGAYAMGAYSQIISVYNLFNFPFDLKISKCFIFGQLYWFCSMLPG